MTRPCCWACCCPASMRPDLDPRHPASRAPPNVAMSGLTISKGSADKGGGILENGGSLTLTNCTLSGNVATTGGGLENDGTTVLSNCTFSGNLASGPSASGGGINNFGTATLN